MLPAQHFPLPVSLHERILQQLSPRGGNAGGAGAATMRLEEVVDYLQECDDPELSPLQAILARAEQIGDPVAPSPEHSALLSWVGSGFEIWESHFPLAPPLTAQLRRLKPLAARLAVTQRGFATPGAHGLHQLLDALHDAALGWQPDLGRTGEATLKLVEQTVGELLAIPADEEAALARSIAAATESARRLESRSLRMLQRAADVERARLRTERARYSAAQMISEALGNAPLPPAIGDFLGKEWFESAQLVLLKFGGDSPEWAAMGKATRDLANSFSGPRSEADAQPESAARLRRELRRWLIGVQHDAQALNQLLGNLEYTLLRALRGETLESRHYPPIEAPGQGAAGRAPPAGLEEVLPGRWFELHEARGNSVRMQLALRQDEQQLLLLCRPSGQQSRSIDFSTFAGELERGGITPLIAGASFSRCLAAAAGVIGDANLAALGIRLSPASAAAQSAQPVDAPLSESVRTPPASETATATPDKPAPAAQAEELPVPPLGTWLGFHDIDPPLLAKLAMHDAVRRLLIFVNRKGLELRRMDEEEYRALIDGNQIDILEARSNFREEVARARRRLEKHREHEHRE